jgi:glyoxylase-like metal-dependent hydrolase (beta-lactamase superfamily II)
VHNVFEGQTRRQDAVEPLDRETSINAFLVGAGNGRIPIDAGAGRLFGECSGRLPRILDATDYSPESIDAVLLMHGIGIIRAASRWTAAAFFPMPISIFSGVAAVPALGHTAGHSFYEIESRGHHVREIGDIFHAAEIGKRTGKASFGAAVGVR